MEDGLDLEKEAQQSPKDLKTPYQEMMDDPDDKTKIVGGEIISPTALRVPNLEKGETYEQVRKEAKIGGWLSALTNAKDRQPDVQEIINAAKADGVPKETLRIHLESLGIKVVDSGKDNVTPIPKVNQESKVSLTPKDYVDLVARFNRVREQLLVANDRDGFASLGGLPVGAVMNAAWTGGDEKSQDAYAQINNALNEISKPTNKSPEQIPTSPQVKENQKEDDPELILPSGKKATWVRNGAVFDEKGNFHLGGGDISGRMSRPRRQPGAQESQSEEFNSFAIHIPPEIDRAAYFASRNGEVDENGDPVDYTYYVGKKMGWTEDPPGSGDWIIPAGQIERITDKRAVSMMKPKK